ncbi:hypothetical protein R5H30_14130 [Sulfitobacter sp. D35]|uniref:hypothetical protein n=1 Tax=Sulfitobacter sp. D35 TaxID=3083252 RepID=UPI00296FB257|nr:hypothetical protein [Sulfitobacter sp. D35]MDW4499131.1 hypothetical protein [Sulfitobacter sp. D35]
MKVSRPSPRRRIRHTVAGLVSAAVIVGSGTTASAVPLNFEDLVGRATGYTVIGRSDVARSTTAKFTNVATDSGRTVDARIVATVKAETDFGEVGNSGRHGDPGFIPDYRPSGTRDGGDLGIFYYGNGINSTENGVRLGFEFFDGTGAQSGTFSNAIEVSELNFAIYDVDGESRAKGGWSDQSEFFRAFVSDGLQSYQLGNTPQALTAEQEGDVITFRGPNKNFSESDATGAVILKYANVSSFDLDFGSVQSYGTVQNAVFSAFDGDLSLVDLRNFRDPMTPQAVPGPLSLPLLAAGVGLLGFLRRRNRT